MEDGLERRPLELEVGLADSELRFYERRGDVLSITIQLWDGRLMTLAFPGVVWFTDRDMTDFCEIYEVSGLSASLRSVLQVQYEVLPESHPFRTFEIESVDGATACEIVAEQILVSVTAGPEA